jgi:hypothetical protein
VGREAEKQKLKLCEWKFQGTAFFHPIDKGSLSPDERFSKDRNSAGRGVTICRQGTKIAKGMLF